MSSYRRRFKARPRQDDQRPQIVHTMYSTQHALLQSFRQIYFAAQGLVLVAVSILISFREFTPWLVFVLAGFGMIICVIWSWQCSQRARSWKFFRGYLRKLEDKPALSVKPLKEYEQEFRGALRSRQNTMLKDLGFQRRRWPLRRLSPAFFIDIVLPLFFLIMWGCILYAALAKAT